MCGKVLSTVGAIGLAVAGAVTGNPALIAAGVGMYSSGKQTEQAKKGQAQQADANATADANSKAALTQQEQAINKANAKQPNVAALLTQNQNDTSLGGTNLTGVGGVQRSDLQLGKNTLLGE